MSLRALSRKLRTPRSRWPRFSLLTLFLAAIFVSLLFSNLYTAWQLGEVHVLSRARKETIRVQEEELRLYRQQLGILAIQDPAMAHVIALETHQNMVWKFRVFVPVATSFAVKSVVGKIPEVELPQAKPSNTIGPGEWILTFSLTRRTDGKWVERIDRVSDSLIYEHFAKVHESEIDWQRIFILGDRKILEPVESQKASDADLPIQLVRVRAKPDMFRRNRDMDPPTDGFMFWLEPN